MCNRYLPILGALLSAVLSYSSAQAQTATQNITISASVAKSCSIGGSSMGGTSALTVPTTNGFVAATPLTPTGSPFATVSCNAPSNLQLTSDNQGVTTSGTPPPNFASKFDYTASATWNSVTATINTSSSASGTAQPVSTAFTGSLSVSVTPIGNSNQLIAGAYSDVLHVTLTPQ